MEDIAESAKTILVQVKPINAHKIAVNERQILQSDLIPEANPQPIIHPTSPTHIPLHPPPPPVPQPAPHNNRLPLVQIPPALLPLLLRI